MDRFITRITIILVTIYFIVSYLFALCGIDILTNSYVILFEACVVSYTFCSGRFHCVYIRWTALSLLVADIINHTDYYFNYIPVNIFNILPISILALGVTTSVALAFRHFYQVIMIKRLKDGRK
jgi:hypothetical protein